MTSPPLIFDRSLIARRLAARAPADNFVLKLVLDDLADRLSTVTRSFQRALVMAPDVREIASAARSGSHSFTFERMATLSRPPDAPTIDVERLDLPNSYDLIVSLLDLQVVNDLPGFLARVHAHLAPDGLFLAALLGGDTLQELRAAFVATDSELFGGAFARVAPFLRLADAGPLLQRAGFALPVADIESHVVRYQTPLALMRELRQLGASNPLAERPDIPASPRLLALASRHYEQIAGDSDGRVRATLEIVWLSGWRPHESQQKPLRPGTAQVSLASVLKSSVPESGGG